MKIKQPNILHDWSHDVDLTMCKQKKRPSVLKYQSDIASKPASETQSFTLTKNRHLTSLKAFELGIGACTSCFERLHNMTCFACNSEFSETVEIRQRSVFIDVS